MSPALQLVPLLEPIREDLERVDGQLYKTVAEAGEPLSSRLLALLSPGKRLRPALVILTGQVFGAGGSPFQCLAAAVEMLHCATLIHDDLVDDSAVRRGQHTLHTLWPAGATVLAGDFLLARSVALVAELGRPRIVRVLAQSLCTISTGEIRRLLVTDDTGNQRQQYHSTIEAKTASLFGAIAEMAGILAGAEEIHITALHRFGLELGMAFQIVDDILDLTGDESRLGKPVGGDLRQGLVTLPVIYYLEQVSGDTAVQAVLSGQRDEEHVRAAIEAIRSSAAIEGAFSDARAHIRRSQEALGLIPANAPRETLSALSDYVVDRWH